MLPELWTMEAQAQARAETTDPELEFLRRETPWPAATLPWRLVGTAVIVTALLIGSAAIWRAAEAPRERILQRPGPVVNVR